MGDGQAGRHALLFLGGQFGFGRTTVPTFLDERSQLWIGLRGVQGQGMFGGHGNVSGAHERVGAGGEHPQSATFAHRMRKADPYPVALADPVLLHQLDLFGPIGQLIQRRQQFLGVLGDRQVIHRDFVLLDQRAGAPTTTIDHLLVGEHGLVHRVPVDHAGLQVGDALFQHPQEQPLVPAVILRLAGSHLAFPVHRETQQPQLFFHVGDVVESPLRRGDPGSHGRVLRRQAEGVPTHRLQHVLAQHALVAGDHVANGVVAHMAHVQSPAGIGEHRQTVELFAARLFAHGEGPLLIPIALRFRFNGLRVVRLGDHGCYLALKRSAVR